MERAVGKNEKLENFKLKSLKLESFAEVGKNRFSNFSTSAISFQLQRNFPTSKETFQLRPVTSNFAGLFPTSAKLSNFRLSNLKLSNFSFFPTTRIPKNLTYDQVLRIFVWILFPEMTLGDAPKTNFSKFSWILFPKMTLGDAPNFWILFPRFANMG